MSIHKIRYKLEMHVFHMIDNNKSIKAIIKSSSEPISVQCHISKPSENVRKLRGIEM